MLLIDLPGRCVVGSQGDIAFFFSRLEIFPVTTVQVCQYVLIQFIVPHLIEQVDKSAPAGKVAAGDLPATHNELERMYEHLESTMLDTGYLNPDNPRMMMPRFRRLFNRSALNRSEVQLLRGLFASLEKLSKHIKGR